MINVGAATETEMKEKKARVEDALHATRAAVEEGIVPGGGVAYLRSLPALDRLSKELEGDEKVGVSIVKRALEQPLRTLCENAGLEGSIIVEKVKAYKGEEKFMGFDVDNGDVRRHVQGRHHRPDQGRAHGAAERGERGEPAAHHRGLVAEVPEKKKAPAMPGGGGGGYGGEDF